MSDDDTLVSAECIRLANGLASALSEEGLTLQQQLTVVGLSCASLLGIAEEAEHIVDDVTDLWLDWIRSIIPTCKKGTRATIGETVILEGPLSN